MIFSQYQPFRYQRYKSKFFISSSVTVLVKDNVAQLPFKVYWNWSNYSWRRRTKGINWFYCKWCDEFPFGINDDEQDTQEWPRYKVDKIFELYPNDKNAQSDANPRGLRKINSKKVLNWINLFSIISLFFS